MCVCIYIYVCVCVFMFGERVFDHACDYCIYILYFLGGVLCFFIINFQAILPWPHTNKKNTHKKG